MGFLNPFNSIITAVLIDGGFFFKRYRNLFLNSQNHTPTIKVENLYKMVSLHVKNEYLYRIIYYDCYPLAKKFHNPITGKAINFEKTPQAEERLEIFNELKKKSCFETWKYKRI